MSYDNAVLQVVAAALRDGDGRVLIAQRPPGSHLAGGWEFPGGKLEAGEEPLAGLARELLEELGIELGAGPHRPLMRVEHAYKDRSVSIQVWIVAKFAGLPQGLDGQALRWCSLEELDSASLLPADAPIVRALRLPERLTQKSSEYFEIVDTFLPRSRERRLKGLPCSSKGDVRLAEECGAEFAVLTKPLRPSDLRDLCLGTRLPVFARGLALEQAYELGATGLNEI